VRLNALDLKLAVSCTCTASTSIWRPCAACCCWGGGFLGGSCVCICGCVAFDTYADANLSWPADTLPSIPAMLKSVAAAQHKKCFISSLCGSSVVTLGFGDATQHKKCFISSLCGSSVVTLGFGNATQHKKCAISSLCSSNVVMSEVSLAIVAQYLCLLPFHGEGVILSLVLKWLLLFLMKCRH